MTSPHPAFGSTSVMDALPDAQTKAGIPIFAVSTFVTDGPKGSEARTPLREADHSIDAV